MGREAAEAKRAKKKEKYFFTASKLGYPKTPTAQILMPQLLHFKSMGRKR
jgi:hypothetical protein